MFDNKFNHQRFFSPEVIYISQIVASDVTVAFYESLTVIDSVVLYNSIEVKHWPQMAGNMTTVKGDVASIPAGCVKQKLFANYFTRSAWGKSNKLFSVAWILFCIIYSPLLPVQILETQTDLFIIIFYIKKDIEYFILTSTNLSIYTATEAIDSHFNFRGTKTGNFLLLQVATFAIFQNRMFAFQPLCQWILWHWISGCTGEEGRVIRHRGSGHWMKDINPT